MGGSRKTHSRTVPARDGTDVSYVRETGNLAEGLPAIFCYEAVCPVGAGGGEETGVRVVILGVVSDYLELDIFALVSGDSDLARRMKG